MDQAQRLSLFKLGYPNGTDSESSRLGMAGHGNVGQTLGNSLDVVIDPFVPGIQLSAGTGIYFDVTLPFVISIGISSATSPTKFITIDRDIEDFTPEIAMSFIPLATENGFINRQIDEFTLNAQASVEQPGKVEKIVARVGTIGIEMNLRTGFVVEEQ